MIQKQIDEIVEAIQQEFRTFGGGIYNPNSNNPIAFALKDKPAQFAAGVDVKDVVTFVLKMSINMTPEQEAKELIEKFKNIENCIEHFDTDGGVICIHHAKACALICVDEIIKQVAAHWDSTTPPVIQYWKEVKQSLTTN